MASPRGIIEKRMLEMGIAPKRSLGQNFLIAEHVIYKITDEALRRKPAQIIEVGPGLGALTEVIHKSGIPLLLVELDRELAEYWRKRGYQVIEEDALKVNWDALSLPERTLLLSNLPYQIASRLIIDRSLGPLNIENMILMMQKEVAQRLMSEPRTKDYGFLTVVAQAYWKMRLLCEAGPGDFYPAPNVASRVLTFERKTSTLPNPAFVEFIKKAFTNRRKFMIKNFSNGRELSDILRTFNYSEKVRAEEISVEDFIGIFNALKALK